MLSSTCFLARSSFTKKYICYLSQFSASYMAQNLELVDENDRANFVTDRACDVGSFTYSSVQLKMHQCARSGFFKEALDYLKLMLLFNGKPTLYDYNGLLYNYFKSEGAVPGEAIKLYVQMMRFGPYPNALTFNTVVNGLLKFGAIEDALFVIKDMHNYGFLPSFMLTNKLFKKSLQLPGSHESIEILKLIVELGYFPTDQSLHLLFSKLCNMGKAYDACFLFSYLVDRRVYPSAYSYNLILFGLSKHSLISHCLEFLCFLKKKGLTLDVFSFTALVYGFSKKGFFKDACQVMSWMWIEGCIPNTVTYTILFQHLFKLNRVDEFWEIFNTRRNHGHRSDLMEFNVILQGLFCHGRFSQIIDVTRIMDVEGLSPDCFTFSVIVGGLCNLDQPELAYDFGCKFLSEGCSLDLNAFNIFVRCLCCMKTTSEACCWVENMVSEGFTPNSMTYSILIGGLCREERLDEAFELLRRYKSMGIQPGSFAYNSVLSIACKLGKGIVIRELLSHSLVEDISLDVIGLTIMIQYFCGMGELKFCFDLVALLITKAPDLNLPTFTYNVLLNTLCKGQYFGTALLIFDKLNHLGAIPDIISYNIVLHALIKTRQYSFVRDTLMTMISQGFDLDVFTYASINLGLCQELKISAALSLRKQVMEFGISPNLPIDSCILLALIRTGDMRNVNLFLADMTSQAYELNVSSMQELRHTLRDGINKNIARICYSMGKKKSSK